VKVVRIKMGSETHESILKALKNIQDNKGRDVGSDHLLVPYGVDIQIGDDPDLPLPSATGVHISRQLEALRHERQEDVRGMVITNYTIPEAISSEFQDRGIKVVQIAHEADQNSITETVSKAVEGKVCFDVLSDSRIL
jgi:hypothetical protein